MLNFKMDGGELKILASEALILSKRNRTAISKAMNSAAFLARSDLQEKIREAFDRPTPWIVKGVAYSKSTPANMALRFGFDVGFGGRNEINKQGVPRSAPLAAEIEGGGRRLKRHEIAFQKIGILPAGMMIVPGAGAKLDRYGNVSSGLIVRLLAFFQAFGEQGYKANMSREKRGRMNRGTRGGGWFALPVPKNGLPAGVFERKGRGVVPVLLFVKAPIYRARFPFYSLSEDFIGKHFTREFPIIFEREARNVFSKR